VLCNLGKERFLELAPDFVGDILWEHLEQMLKGTWGDLAHLLGELGRGWVMGREWWVTVRSKSPHNTPK
jgi:hypothetical protein